MIKADPKHSIVRRQPQSVEFGFYTDEDVRARSVCEVTSSVALDLQMGTAMPNGLYDARFGPFDATDVAPCMTCACRYMTCPGHAGHLELCVPVYHPLLFNRIMTLLRMKCLNCHTLRAPLRVLQIAQAKIDLLQQGRTMECVELDTLLARAIHQDRTLQQQDDTGNSSSANNNNPRSAKALSLDQAGRAVDKALQSILSKKQHASTTTNTTTSWTSYERGIQRQLVQEVISVCKSAKQCAHCGAYSPKLRQDASNKIFQVALSDTQQRYNVAQGIPAHFESAISLNDKKSNKKNNHHNDDTNATSGYDSDESREIAEELPDVDMEDADGEDNDGDDDDDATRNASNAETAADGTSAAAKAKGKRREDKFMPVSEVKAQVQRTYALHAALLQHVLGPPRFMFLQAIPIPPSRFRPPMKMAGMTVEHAQNFYLNNMIQMNERLRNHLAAQQQQKQGSSNRDEERKAYQVWIELQTTVNCFMDSSKDPSNNSKNAPTGIRQILERKEGIFRKHMMGKRVDFACRSVISPDPYIGTNEIGIPLYFAMTLTYPTPVTDMNIAEMRVLVERGADEYPGARFVEFPGGRRIDLSKMERHKRQAVAARLLTHLKKTNVPAMVGRQLRNGDMMLVNRQPTLHKPGIMAHYVRVLHSPTQKTIRMHYTNCDTYNADFDGDEMNCHFPQNDLARAESEYICKTDLQYIVPTDGTPLRGLIQDHVDSGVKLTKRDTFLEKWQYQQLLFAGLASLPGLEIIASHMNIEMMPPAISKPRELWTGKQVISTLLLHLGRGQRRGDPELAGISTERKAKTPETAFGSSSEEHLVLIRDGELLRGVLDKSSFGATEYSLIHGVYEAYGPTKAGLFLNSLGRLFTAYLQFFAGHSCRMEDLILTEEAEKNRRRLVELSYNKGSWAAKAWADSDAGKMSIDLVLNKENAYRPLSVDESSATAAKIGELLSGSEGARNFASLDSYMQSQLNPLSSEIIKACLPNGLAIPFPENTFSLMVTTGAKGSTVNQSQVSCCLGQQALEGRRVPRLSSGRTLPSFAPFDPNPRADGFVMDRFLTGIRPQEYYFHCMAGREGLVDTAVKTSRSGYLQRCLVKHLEELKVCYDFTVRNGEGCVVQFLYGEDGLDPTKAAYLDCSSKSLEFIARNHKSLKARNPALPNSTIDIAASDASRSAAIGEQNSSELLSVGSFVLARKLRVGTKWVRGALCTGWHDAVIIKKSKKRGTCDIKYLKDETHAKKVPIEVDFGRCGGTTQAAASSICILIKPAAADPIISTPNSGSKVDRLGSSGCCLSERVASALSMAMRNEKGLREAMKSADISDKELGALVSAKYGLSLCAPGEAVGSIAAQSVGEPSTQMTLNTFHLAGAGANVTLGIPRLREIIMTASKEIKTPTMSVPLHTTVTEKQAVKLARFFTKLPLLELVASQSGIKVVETLSQGDAGNWQRTYHVTMKLHPAERIKEAFGITLRDIATVVGNSFVPKLAFLMKQELRRSAIEGDVGASSVEGAESSKFVQDVTDAAPRSKRRSDNNDADELENTGNDNDDDDEGIAGEEDGVMAARLGHKSEMDTYEDMDDDDRAANNTQLVSDDEGSVDEEENPNTPSNETENEMSSSFKERQGVTMDKTQNTIVLPPLRVDPSARPLLMVGLVEKAAASILVRSRSKIEQAFVNEEEGRGRCLQTAGVNFEEMWKLDNVDHDRLLSNDIWAVRCAYGVEAARGNIVEQIRAVFGAYGIEVDHHHLSLIADYMTFDGGYIPMNRIGMETASSPFLQMSFETTAHFLTQAALNSRTDDLQSPSANLVMGRPIRHGTGAIELLAA